MSSIAWINGNIQAKRGEYEAGAMYWTPSGDSWLSVQENSQGQITYYNLHGQDNVGVLHGKLTLANNYRCKQINIDVYVAGNETSQTTQTLKCNLYTKSPISSSNYQSGYIASASVTDTLSARDGANFVFKKLRFSFTGLDLSSTTDIYFYFTGDSSKNAVLGLRGGLAPYTAVETPKLSATFQPLYTLSASPASVTAGSKVTVTIGNGSGTSVTVRIKKGSTQLWSGTTTTGSIQATVANSWFTTAGVTGHSMSLTVTIDQDTSLSASFTAVKNYTLSVSPASVATGSNVSISIGNGSGNSITARIKYGSTQLWSGTSTNGSFSVAVNKSWFTTAGITTAKSMAVTVTIDQDTSLSAALTVTAGSNMNPTVGTLSFAPVNTGRVATNFPNSYIAGYSKVKVSAAVTSGSNATISSVVLSFPGGTNVTMSYNSTSQKYEGTTAAVINGNTTFTVTAKDGRTLSGSKQGTLSGVVAYVKPSVSPTAANCYRCNSSGTKQDGGTYVTAKATATWYSSLSGNALTSFLFYVKEDRTAGYTDYRNLTSGQQSQALQMHVPGENDFVTLVFRIQDKVSDIIEIEFRLPAAMKNVYVRRSSTGTYVGVGMAPQRTSGKSDIELPDGGAVLIGGVPLQSVTNYSDDERYGNQFGKNFLSVNPNNPYDVTNTEVEFYQRTAEANWTNSPLGSSATLLGIRRVIILSSTWYAVTIQEFYPTAGRLWTNFYNNGSWTGWKSITPA